MKKMINPVKNYIKVIKQVKLIDLIHLAIWAPLGLTLFTGIFVWINIGILIFYFSLSLYYTIILRLLLEEREGLFRKRIDFLEREVLNSDQQVVRLLKMIEEKIEYDKKTKKHS